MVTGKQVGAVLLLAAIFALGGAAGRMSMTWGHRGGAAQPPQRSQRFIATLDRELKLTPTQRDSVQTILSRWDPAMRAAWDEMRPKFDSLRALVRADIMQVLTDDQRAAFKRWTARNDSLARNRPKEEQRAR
jgi:Spy/CpxP family protein refolding chaperone